jgi:adenylate cyclase
LRRCGRVFAEEPGGYCEAAHAARRAVQSIPSLSLSRSLLAAAFAKLGRIEEAKAVGCKCWALDRSFSANQSRAARDIPAALAQPLADAWSAAGLPL